MESSIIESGEFSTVTIESGRPLYLVQLPEGAIKEVYVGYRSKANSMIIKDTVFYDTVNTQQKTAKVFRCDLHKSKWNLKRLKVDMAHYPYKDK